jgi:hypothetical protein
MEGFIVNTSLQMESTPPWKARVSRALLSGLICLFLVGIVAVNLPDSELRKQLLVPGGPVLNAVGLDQNWRIFAPDPRRESVALEARLSLADGGQRTWRPVALGDLFGAYRDYRWRKWVELVRRDDHSALWDHTARWIAARVSNETGRGVIRLALVRRWRPLNPPGVQPPQGPWKEYVFFRMGSPR